MITIHNCQTGLMEMKDPELLDMLTDATGFDDRLVRWWLDSSTKGLKERGKSSWSQPHFGPPPHSPPMPGESYGWKGLYTTRRTQQVSL